MRLFVFIVALVLCCSKALCAIDQNTLDAYLQAATERGNAIRGQQVFANPKANCAQCHSVDGRGDKLGPDLLGIAQKMDALTLARAVLQPSKEIKPGYEPLKLITDSGEVLTGIVQRASNRSIDLKLSDGKVRTVLRDEIEQQSISSISMMPSDMEKAIGLDDFRDLIAYLRSLELPMEQTRDSIVNPIRIPAAKQLARLVPVLGSDNELRRPVAFLPWPGEPNVFAVAEVEPAQIWRLCLPKDATQNYTIDLFADLTGETRAGSIEGLFCMAFHPDFLTNGRYFVKMHQAGQGNAIVMQVQERQADLSRKVDSGLVAKTILSQPMPHINHNGGSVLFGPDSKMYVGFGDGGPQEDPNGFSQSLDTWLGKILRLDVDDTSVSDGSRPYAIPADNPFVNTPGAKPEIWALGFREPWRMTFDRMTGDLWVGDVGQNRIEEVTVVRAGDNHGWNIWEGFEPFSNRYRREGVNYVPPVFSYSHRHGVSVTGGYVYRGPSAKQMLGQYVFGDFETKRIWSIQQQERRAVSVVEICESPSRIASFGEDTTGELYVVGHDPANIYRLDLADVDSTPATPTAVLTTAEVEPMLWRYTERAPANDWWKIDFDDSTWNISPAGFGSPGTPGAVVRTQWNSADIWCRREFDLPTTIAAKELRSSRWILRVHHDEDATIWINGNEAMQLPRWTTGYVDILLSNRAVESLKPGRNVIAVHCHQNGGGQYLDVGLYEIKPNAN